MVIFPAKKLNLYWTLCVDVFAEWNEDKYTNNVGIGERYPGLLLFGSDGKEIPVFFSATTNASINASVFIDAFKMMDNNRITMVTMLMDTGIILLELLTGISL